MASCTSTSGLSWKLDGRLGDSPIVGAGMYCDNSIGCAGSTGRGESVIQVGGALSVVHLMDKGLTPTEACVALLKKLVDMTKLKRLKDDQGRPKFDVTMYALRKDGAYGAATIHQGAARTGSGVPVMLTTHPTAEGSFRRALAAILASRTVSPRHAVMRIL